MNFQPIEYLNDLNLNFDILSPNIDTQDLDLFADTNFLNYDFNEPVKTVLDSSNDNSVVNNDATAAISPNPASVSPVKLEPSSFESIDSIESMDNEASSASINDKRKRNTAASARFRIKKKLKEQQMDLQLKKLSEKVVSLEKTLKQLNMENKCLKSLIVQKNDEKNQQLLQTIKSRSILDSNVTFEYTN